MKALGLIDGTYFSFAKGTFPKTILKEADACAKIFELDPLVLYTNEIFLEKISDAARTSNHEAKEALDKYGDVFSLQSPKELLTNIRNVANPRALTFLIAYNLKEKGPQSIFLSRAAVKLLPDIIHAASFLVKYQLI